MINEAVVFNALGDPTRLKLVRRLSKGNSFTITAVSYDLGISRQGVRRHIQVLVKADLVRLEPKGRDVLVHLNPETLEKAKQFIAKLELQWDQRLDALKNFVEGAG